MDIYLYRNQQAQERGTQMTIKLFRDGTYQTTDPNTGKTDSGTIDLSNLGLDPSLLQTHNDLELVIIPPDKDEDQKDSTASSEISSPQALTPKIGSSKGATPITGKVTDGESVVRKQVVNRDKTFSCSFCPRTFRFYRHLQCHEYAHSQDQKYDCHICQKMFVREKNLKLHLGLHKKETIPRSGKKKQTQNPIVDSPCKMFGKVLKQKSILTRHMKDIHKSEPFNCQICNYSFNSESNAQRHMRQHYGPFPCIYCCKSFTNKDVRNYHVREDHQIKVQTCHLCGKELFSVGKLLSHLYIMHPKDEDAIKAAKNELKCDLCDKKFANSKAVRVHRLTHTGEKKHQCPHCPWKFCRLFQLRNHIKVHEKSDKALPGKKIRFFCDFCTRDYGSEAAMIKHERQYHKGPFQCQLCKVKKFPDKQKLKEHAEEKHAGNCYKCNICELLFTSGRYSEIHLLSSHPMANVCGKCGYSFRRKDEMYEHIKFNHFDGDEELFRAEYPEVTEPVERTDYEALEKTKTCPRCDRTFTVYKGLMSHMKVCDGKKKKTDGEDEERIPMETSMEEIVPFVPIDKEKLRVNPQCPDCGKIFSKLAAVLSHMRYCKKGIKKPTSSRGKASQQSSPTEVKSEPDEILLDSTDYVPYTFLETEHYVK